MLACIVIKESETYIVPANIILFFFLFLYIYTLTRYFEKSQQRGGLA